ncbi:thioredoxin family protein [Pontibacillus salicampi]|uniref:Thioredoxin family protein n=1 Tax=Pontibacillus salicampi TaxID=1449801 RepID=A0ABV6LT22_9BACI
MNLNDWYEKGITPQDYISSMTKHQENLMHVYRHFELPEEDKEQFEMLRNRELCAIILTEDWCGDAMLNLPIFLKIAGAASIDTRVLYRDENPELMDQYLTNGSSRSIPIIIVFNNNGEEVARWGPRAPELQSLVDNAQQNLPEKDNPIFEEKQREMIMFLTRAYRENEELWSKVYMSLKQTILNV